MYAAITIGVNRYNRFNKLWNYTKLWMHGVMIFSVWKIKQWNYTNTKSNKYKLKTKNIIHHNSLALYIDLAF